MRLPLNLSNYNFSQSNTLTTKDNPSQKNIVNPYIASPYPPNSHQLPLTYHLDSSTNHHQQPKQLQQPQQQQQQFGAHAKSTNPIDPQQTATTITDDALVDSKPIKRNNSLISFKSLDLNLKTIYSNIKQKHKEQQQVRTNSCGSASGSNAGSKNDTTSSSKTSISRTPYVRVETVDKDESQENLLLNYPHSPYSHRGSFDKSSASGSQFLSATGGSLYPDYMSQSHGTTPSSFLTISSPPNVRRSSTSDICESKKTLTSSVSQPTTSQCPETSRRPSTSDLLRRARERKGGSEAASKIGRSVSHGGIPRGGRGGRRTSMAF